MSKPALPKTNRNPAIRTLATDYSVKLFENKNLLLFEVFRANLERTGDPVIKDVTFKNCHIEGPAVLLPLNANHFDDCNFGISHGDMRTLIMNPASPDKVTGAIPATNCTFQSVDFFSIGFTGAKPFLDSLLEIDTWVP